MDTKKSLTRHYVHLSNWKCEYRQSVIKFLNDALSFFDGGAAELDVPYRSYDEADAADEDFDEQFPASVYIEDRHGFQHEVYVTRLYKRNDLYYVDGFDNTDGVWITGWYTSSDTATYDTLAYFIDAVLNPADDDAVPLADGSIFSGGFTSQLVGYQLVDDVDNYPAGLGAFDVFRTSADAWAMRDLQLDPSEWLVIEVWTTPDLPAGRYTLHSVTDDTDAL